MSNTSNGSVKFGRGDLSVLGNTLSAGYGYIHDNYAHDLVPYIARNGNHEHADTMARKGN